MIVTNVYFIRFIVVRFQSFLFRVAKIEKNFRLYCFFCEKNHRTFLFVNL